MILPFVREIFAELEQSSSFDRVRRHLSLGVGRRRVSGLTNTARSLYIPLLARAAQQLGHEEWIAGGLAMQRLRIERLIADEDAYGRDGQTLQFDPYGRLAPGRFVGGI